MMATVATAAALGRHCVGVSKPSYYLPNPPWNLLSNFTTEAMTTGNFLWLVPVGEAMTEVTNTAFALRLVLSDYPERYDEFWHYWLWNWCAFLDAVRNAASSLPRSAWVVSAFNKTARDILMHEVPQAFAPLLGGVVRGKRNLGDAYVAASNTSIILLQYLECALVLGEEALQHGRTRVQQAIFHGSIVYRGNREYTVHRSDAILSALTGELGPGSAVGENAEPPRVVELGVHYGDFAYRMLMRHPTLTWIGIDPYECECEDGDLKSFRDNMTGDQVHASARWQLQDWLGGRARMIIARSTMVLEAEIGPDPFDCLFVDAVHTEAAVKEDLALWAPRVRPGGLVAGHDYAFGYMGVVQAVHATLPKGCTLHLGPNSVFWWLHAPPGGGASC